MTKKSCDEEVLRMGCEPADYVEGILKVCQFYTESPLPCVSGVTGADVKKRLRAILAGSIARELTIGKRAALMAIGLATLTAPIVIGVLNAPQVRAQSPQPAVSPVAQAEAAKPLGAQIAAPQGGAQQTAYQVAQPITKAPAKLEFEVASVRASAPQSGPERPVNGDISGGPGTSDPTRMTFRRVPLSNILMTAFDVPENRLKAPEWTANVETPITKNLGTITPTAFRYDITATMLPGTTKAQAHEMLRNLLIDRFKLTYHFEKKNFDGYMATVSNGGSKLKPSEAANDSEAGPLAANFPLGPDGFAEVPAGQPAIVATIVDDSSRKVRWTVRKIPVSSLLEMLKVFYPLAARVGDRESWAGNIFDGTGLTGTYDFKLEYPLGAFGFGRALEYALGGSNFADRGFDISWKGIVRFQTATEIKPDFNALAREAVAEMEGPDSDPALISAIEKQLGIKLVKNKIPLDVVTVDRIEKIPTEN